VQTHLAVKQISLPSLQNPIGTPFQLLLQQNDSHVLVGNFHVDDILFRWYFLQRVNVHSPAKRDWDLDGTALILGTIVKHCEQAARLPFDQTGAKI
jgi:hypothetical protein